MVKARTRLWLVLPLLVAAAFALRIFQLQQQSLWYDEAFSVWLAHMDLGAITARTAADIQPPLYYYLLHFWIGPAGDGEFAVRFLSLFFGVLTIPLLYALARRAFGPSRALAVFAALLAVLSPLYLWYSQETRMYTLITFLGMLSSYALLRALDEKRALWWAVFSVASIAAVYTHYFAFALFALQLLVAAWRLARQPAAKSSRRLLLAVAAIVVAFLPWLPFLVTRLGQDVSYWQGPLKLDEALRHILINFTMGESVLEPIAYPIALDWLALLAICLVAWLAAMILRGQERRPTRDGRERQGPSSGSEARGIGFAILYLLVPLALLLVLFYRNPKFNARYLMIASPALWLLLGAGLGALWNLVRRGNPLLRGLAGVVLLAALGLLLSTELYADYNVYFDPAFTKPDFRSAAEYVQSHAAPDEAVILVSGHMFPAFDYYAREASLSELRLPDDPTLNADHILDFPSANDLNRALIGKRGAWLVLWQDEVADPNGLAPLLLSTRGTEQPVDAQFWHIQVRHWTLPEAYLPFSASPEIEHPREANFKNTFKLLGWGAPRPTAADVGASFTLYWQDLAEVSDDYQVAFQVVDAQGNVWGKTERRPAGYYYPTTRWKKGQDIFGNYLVPLLPGTPAGDYYVTVTLFTAGNPTGLDVLAGNGAPIGRSVKLGPIKVLPAEKQPSVVDLQIQHTLSAPASPFTLLGYSLPRESASTGESIPLTLFWRLDEAPRPDYTFELQFGDAATARLPLANASYPTSLWRGGEIVRGQYLVQIPPGASSGSVDLALALSSGQRIDLRQPFTVEKTDRIFTSPAARYLQNANFSGLISLSGYDLSATQVHASTTLTVTLLWKAAGKLDRPYTVFVHLLDNTSKVQGQNDAQPLNGARPTNTWVEGEYLVDSYPIEVKPDAPPGEYRVEIGWYDGSDPAFARLQVLDDTGGGAGDNVILGQKVTVTAGK